MEGQWRRILGQLSSKKLRGFSLEMGFLSRHSYLAVTIFFLASCATGQQSDDSKSAQDIKTKVYTSKKSDDVKKQVTLEIKHTDSGGKLKIFGKIVPYCETTKHIVYYRPGESPKEKFNAGKSRDKDLGWTKCGRPKPLKSGKLKLTFQQPLFDEQQLSIQLNQRGIDTLRIPGRIAELATYANPIGTLSCDETTDLECEDKKVSLSRKASLKFVREQKVVQSVENWLEEYKVHSKRSSVESLYSELVSSSAPEKFQLAKEALLEDKLSESRRLGQECKSIVEGHIGCSKIVKRVQKQEKSPMNSKVDRRLSEAKRCEEKKDWACAAHNYQRACELHDSAKGCSNLGDFYFSEELGNKYDVRKAKSLYQSACENNFFPACHNLGQIYFENLSSSEENHREGLSLYKKACNGEVDEACQKLGKLYQYGQKEGISRSLTKSLKFFKKGCLAGNLSACEDAALAALESGGTKKHFKVAREILEKTCNKGRKNSCGYLGLLYFSGKKGTEKNKEKARPLLAKGCEAKNQRACGALGRILMNPQGEPIDAERAEKLLQTACKNGSGRHCHYLAAAHDNNKWGLQMAPAKMKMYYKQGCQNNYYKSCLELGGILVVGKYTVKKNISKGSEYLEKACKNMGADTCKKGAETLIGEAPRKSRRLMVAACNNGPLPQACFWAGFMYESKEKGGGVNLSKAVGFYRKGCRSGSQKSCVSLALKYATGEAVIKNKAKARQLLRQTCKEGHEEACRILRKASDL